MFLKEWLRMGSSAARDALLSMMKTRMRLVKMWWLMSLWQPTRMLRGEPAHGPRPASTLAPHAGLGQAGAAFAVPPTPTQQSRTS